MTLTLMWSWPPCKECGRDSTHSIVGKFTIYLCCKCYVEAGNPPSDWHPICMRTFEELKKNDKKEEGTTRLDPS